MNGFVGILELEGVSAYPKAVTWYEELLAGGEVYSNLSLPSTATDTALLLEALHADL